MDLNLFSYSPVFAYLAIFVGMSLEAMVTLFAVVFALTRGHLNPVLALIVLVIGAVAEQLLWYYIGRHLNRFNKIIHFSNKYLGHLDLHFERRSFYVMILSKFIYGLHRTVLIRFGMLKVPLIKYLRLGIAAVAIWLLLLGGVAYLFSESYLLLQKYFKYAEVVVLGMVVLFVGAQYFISKRLRKDL